MSFKKINQNLKTEFLIQKIVNEKYQGNRSCIKKTELKRLKQGEPIDYIIGFVPFLNCQIDLRYKPLIPRPETEWWTEQMLKKITHSKIKCLDLFSGSGCIGIAILKNKPQAHVDFADIDIKCLKQIKINLKLNNINLKRYHVIKSDVFSKINKKYDLITANPPYVSDKKNNLKLKTVLKYEPKKAILANKNGLKYIKIFLLEANKHLKPNGIIYLEYDSCQKKEIEKILKKYPYSEYQFYHDQFNRWRYLVIKKI